MGWSFIFFSKYHFVAVKNHETCRYRLEAEHKLHTLYKSNFPILEIFKDILKIKKTHNKLTINDIEFKPGPFKVNHIVHLRIVLCKCDNLIMLCLNLKYYNIIILHYIVYWYSLQ